MTAPASGVPAATPPKDDPTSWHIDDAVWADLAPLLRSDKPRKKPGRPRRDDRPIFAGLIWLARTGSQWAALPREFGPKSTVHLRFTEWVETGALERAWALLLRQYDAELGLDGTWQAADGCIVKAPFGKKGGPAIRRQRVATRPTGANPAPSGTWCWTGAMPVSPAGTRRPHGGTRRTSRRRRVRSDPSRRRLIRTGIRPGAGWWRWRTAGSTGSGGC